MSKLKVLQNGTFADGEGVYQIGYELEDGSLHIVEHKVMRKDEAKAKLSEIEESKQELSSTELERARNDKGHYIADDPSTPEINEAYVAKKKAPAKKKTPAKKKAAVKKKKA